MVMINVMKTKDKEAAKRLFALIVIIIIIIVIRTINIAMFPSYFPYSPTIVKGMEK